MSSRSWVENSLLGIIVLNFIVLMYVFLIPRAQFMLSNWGEESASLMETSGAMDMPNQYATSYKVANQILKRVGEDAVVLMPSEGRETFLSRSALIQRLYPRKIYFSGDLGWGRFSSYLSDKEAHVVFNTGWRGDFCKERPVYSLGHTGLGICQVDKRNLVLIEKLMQKK